MWADLEARIMGGLNSWSARCSRCQRRRDARLALRPAPAASVWRARAPGVCGRGWWAHGIEASVALGAPRPRLLAAPLRERAIGQSPLQAAGDAQQRTGGGCIMTSV